MEDVLLRGVTEFGFPALISIYLLTKGVSTLNQFASAVKDLSDSVAKLEKRLDNIENKLGSKI